MLKLLAPLLVAGAAAAAVPAILAPQQPDYETIPPSHALLQRKLQASPLKLAAAISAAEEHTGGVAADAQLRPLAGTATVHVFQEGKKWAVQVGADGAVTGKTEVPRFPGASVSGEWTETESGLKYYDLQVGEGESPYSVSRVEVHYTGWLLDGTKFDSSHDRGEPTTFPLDRVIPGWTEGLSSMKPGGRRKLIIPFALAYGEQGRRPTIPPRATLVFDVELLNVLPLPGDPISGEPVATESGLEYFDVKVGQGESPSRTSTVKVHYTGWLTDGTKFDSSRDSGSPAEFQLDGVIQGWAEGLSTMKPGGKRKLIIPSELGYGSRGSGRDVPPDATLIFDVELLEVVQH